MPRTVRPTPAPPFCEPPYAVDLTAPCGFLSITTTCVGATATCTALAKGIATSCSIGPFTGGCSITVKLGDLTEDTIAVTVDTSKPAFACGGNADPVKSPTSSQDFTSSTCTGISDAGTE